MLLRSIATLSVLLFLIAATAPDSAVVDSQGAKTNLSAVWRRSRVAVLYLPDCNSAKERLLRIDQELKAVGITAVCGKAAAGAPKSAAFIDIGGATRRKFPNGGDAALVADIRAWFDGMAVYNGACARCHGADGSDTSYSGIKTLTGIGARHTEAEIVQLAEMTGNNDLHALTPRDRRALGIYVAGL